jgi:hypothetical protein
MDVKHIHGNYYCKNNDKYLKYKTHKSTCEECGCALYRYCEKWKDFKSAKHFSEHIRTHELNDQNSLKNVRRNKICFNHPSNKYFLGRLYSICKKENKRSKAQFQCFNCNKWIKCA